MKTHTHTHRHTHTDTHLHTHRHTPAHTHAQVKPHDAAQMLESAQEFEDMAKQLMKVAFRLNEELALERLERPSKQWQGLTSIDVALLGNSKHFIEECCGAALDYRWSGDLEPYHQPVGLYSSQPLK